MPQQNLTKPAAGHRTAMPRRPRPAASAFSKVLTRTWSLPRPRNRVTVERDLQVPMSDGTILLADHFLPVSVAAAATVLVRCPYGRAGAFGVLNGLLLAERGYHVLLQSCRGTFGSGGEFEPMRHEISDGQDTMAWLRAQSWFDGRVVTYGASYLGFTQWALAMDPPPELAAAVVFVGPHDFSRSAYQHGAFGLYSFLSWNDMIEHQESASTLATAFRSATADRRLDSTLNRVPVRAGARDLLGVQAAAFESWLDHPQPTDPFWEPMQCAAALQRITVPTLLVGGWHDLFIEQTLEQYQVLAGREVPVRLLVGPWTHLETASKGGPAVVESLTWLDRYAAPGRRNSSGDGNGNGNVNGSGQAGPADHSVRFWVGGEGAQEWRETTAWPPPGTTQQRWYLGTHGTLSSQVPDQGTAEPDEGPAVPPARFRYDPADPTPTVGGALLSVSAGTRDNRAIEQRLDVLVFSSEALDQPVEVIGDVIAELAVTRDNAYADVFVRLCDVDPRGRSRNVCDGIVRLTEQDPLAGAVRVSLLGAAHRFGRGHRIRLQVSGGAHPRFARNPGNGQVDADPADFVPTEYEIGLTAGHSSTLVLSVPG
jgi:putative CocE/NonD family hydrolase